MRVTSSALSTKGIFFAARWWRMCRFISGFRLVFEQKKLGTLHRGLPDAEWFATTRQAQTVTDTWRRHYNGIRPREALAMPPPVPGTI